MTVFERLHMPSLGAGPKAFHKLVYFKEVDEGHFAGRSPNSFAAELRAALRSHPAEH